MTNRKTTVEKGTKFAQAGLTIVLAFTQCWLPHKVAWLLFHLRRPIHYHQGLRNIFNGAIREFRGNQLTH